MCLLLTAICAGAQLKVSGTVYDPEGEPLIGASVLAQGSNGTQTDIDGHFTITTDPKGTLTFSYVGYAINRVYEMTPNHPLVLNHRARIFLVANQNEINDLVAQADLETLAALDSDPANLQNRQAIYVQVLGRLGNYYVTNHNIEEAKKMFQRFYEIQPSEELQKYIETLN